MGPLLSILVGVKSHRASEQGHIEQYLFPDFETCITVTVTAAPGPLHRGNSLIPRRVLFFNPIFFKETVRKTDQ